MRGHIGPLAQDRIDGGLDVSESDGDGTVVQHDVGGAHGGCHAALQDVQWAVGKIKLPFVNALRARWIMLA